MIEPLAKLFEPWTGDPATSAAGVRTIKADSGVMVDLNGSQPFTADANWLYLWPGPDSHELSELGNPPKELERFDLTALYVADSKDEEASQQRKRTVSEAIDTKGHAYLELIRRNRSRYEAGTEAPWHNLVGRLDFDTIRNFNVRGVALRIAGYRYV